MKINGKRARKKIWRKVGGVIGGVALCVLFMSMFLAFLPLMIAGKITLLALK
jgi:hypothetical protein